MRLEQKVAIVTGGASGIGEETSRSFATEGALGVVIADVDQKRGRLVVSEIESNGGHAVFFHLDVTNEQNWIEIVSLTQDHYGHLDILVNNAGMSGPESRRKVEDTSEEAWDLIHDVNAKGVFLGTKHAIPSMRKAGGGSIINISSIFGIVGSKGGTPYHSSKGAVRAFTKAAAVQYAGEQIRVNSIHPGFTDTKMTLELHAQPGERSRRISVTPMGRLGTPADIAWGCVYLASDESKWVTGSELVIDGGHNAQ